MRKIGLSLAAAVLLLGGLTACGEEDRWCEHDATDTVVDNSYCEKGTAGYKWETDGGSKSKSKKKTKSSKTRK